MKINIIAGFIICLLLTGCGYTIQKSHPVGSVRIESIENRTFEPRLGNRLNEALALALMKNGIRVDERAVHAIKGTIDRFQLRSLAEKEGITVSYEIIIQGRFFLAGPEAKTRELRSGNVFVVTFSSEGDLTVVTALKEEAVERALSDMAEEIAASVIYGR